MSRRRRMALRIGLPAIAVVVAFTISLVAALSSSAAPAQPSARPTLPLHPQPAPTRVVSTQLYSPFTGEPVRALKPVLAVKIDNIVTARPQTGLQSANIVYVEPVEGGLTRFMAVFSSRVPTTVGPVRSARESDLYLLPQFGRPAFAWSGATPHLVPFIERAHIADLYALQVNGYYRISSRVAPENLYANPRTLLKEAPNASKARDIGFRFGAQPAGGRATGSYTVKYPAATYTFRWSAKAKRWLVWMDGAPGTATEGGQLGGATVIIQDVYIGEVAVRGVRRPAAAGEVDRLRHRGHPAQRAGVHRALVAARPEQRHHVHAARRQADAVRPRPGLGRARAGEPR